MFNQLLFILLLLPGGIGKAPHLAERCLITLQCFLFDPLSVRKPWVSRPETVAFFTQAKTQIGNRLQANAPRYGLVFQENGTTVLLWQIFGALLCGLGPIFAMNIVINNTNAMATAYNTRLGARA